MDYQSWESTVPESIRRDSLWKMTAYRLALFLGDLSCRDVTALVRDRRTLGISNQLFDAVGSVGANLAEGYSKGTGRDRARFYEYALGSAREARHWYYEGRHILGTEVTEHRLGILCEIIRLLLTMVPEQRGYVLREPSASYDVGVDEPPHMRDVGRSTERWWNDVPFPS